MQGTHMHELDIVFELGPGHALLQVTFNDVHWLWGHSLHWVPGQVPSFPVHLPSSTRAK